MLRYILNYVKLAQKQMESSVSKAAPNAFQLSAAKQLGSMLESSPLKLDDAAVMFQRLEELVATGASISTPEGSSSN